MPSRSAIGVDLGGTKVAALLVSEDGTLLGRTQRETPAAEAGAVMEAIHEVVEELAAAGNPESVGVGAAGMVEWATGSIRFGPNVPLREVPISEQVSERAGLPCVVDNDANAAAWGEYRFGAGRPYRDILAVTVGTGIGGGIVTGGGMFRGAHGFAGEIGHIIVEPGGPLCGCGNRGCWEQVASGQAIVRMGAEAAARDPSGQIAARVGGGGLRGHHVSDAAEAGDPAAVAIFAQVGRRLGEGIAGLVNILDPQAVVVGGGVAEEGDLLLEPAREAFLSAVEAPGHRPGVPMLPALLGNDAGAIGAAALALDGT